MPSLPQVEPRVFSAVVQRVEQLAPSLRRVVLGGPDLRGYASTGVGDEYVRLLFPGDELRTYTVRRHDDVSGEVAVDVVLHEGGLAAGWARAARPGDTVGITSPTGMYDAPPGLEWLHLVGDASALPALARILEQVPDHVRVLVVVEVAGPEEQVALPEHPRAEVTWLHGGNGRAPSRLEEVVRSLPRPVGTGYTWVAGETRVLRAVRRHLRRDLALPASSYKAVGYWTEGAEQWRERYAALDPATRESLEQLWVSDEAEDVIEAAYDARLTALGL